MARRMLVVVLLPLLVFALAEVAQAWQGRMRGMGDPYGLFPDESDFLIHPAKIAKGEGVRFYGDYRFTYTDIMDWDSSFEWYDAGSLFSWEDFDFSGDAYGHDALVGASFPLGPGRMGVFFEYAGQQGDYDGEFLASYFADATNVELTHGLDDFAGRLLYGFPAGGVNLGFEAQVAYRQEQKESYWYYPPDPYFYAVNPSYWGVWSDPGFPDYLPVPVSFFPYDSSYWEALLKGSTEFALGPADVEFVLRGGFIFCGDNEWEAVYFHWLYADHWPEDMDGDVEGWQIGGDVWVRYSLGDSLSLPFLVRVDYQEKTRDGEFALNSFFGIPFPGWWSSNHEISEQGFDLEVGGGLDKKLGAGTRIAGGIYYNYLQRKEDLNYFRRDNFFGEDYSTDFNTDLTEHRVILRFVGEHDLSSRFALRAGLSFFYGWAQYNPSYYREEINWFLPAQWAWHDDITADGSHWGIGASLGGTIRLNGFALEPFVTVGWQQLDLDADGPVYDYVDWSLADTYVIEGDLTRSAWYIGGGLSVLFDVP